MSVWTRSWRMRRDADPNFHCDHYRWYQPDLIGVTRGDQSPREAAYRALVLGDTVLGGEHPGPPDPDYRDTVAPNLIFRYTHVNTEQRLYYMINAAGDDVCYPPPEERVTESLETTD